ncbi:MAG: type II toxin-antitoxin system VapC family toxin [Gemmatimonadales bacterium]
MVSVLLDTHILLWRRTAPGRLRWAQSEARGEGAARRAAGLSAISLRGLAAACQRGRIEVGLPWGLWLEEIESNPRLVVLPVAARIAAESVRLGREFRRDPAGQIIVATALCHGLRLATADESCGKLRMEGGLGVGRPRRNEPGANRRPAVGVLC